MLGACIHEKLESILMGRPSTYCDDRLYATTSFPAGTMIHRRGARRRRLVLLCREPLTTLPSLLRTP
jgi:hypothetical protein